MSQAERDSTNSTAARLVAAGVEIAREHGLGALTARSLADRTGASPSALNYHLGGRDALLDEILEEAIAASETWRQERLALVADEAGAPAWASASGAMTAAIASRIDDFRPWALLLAEFEMEAESREALHGPLAAHCGAMADFWRRLAGQLGEPDEAAEAWADLAFGLTQLVLGGEPLTTKLPWIADATGRMQARLRGQAVGPLAERSAGAAERLHASAPASDGARRLLDAALQVIADKGADRLTQRDVAAAAGLSLAATTYFFRTKAELVAAAFGELHRQVGAQAAAGPAVGGGLHRVTLEDGSERPNWRVRAMEALQLASARDASLAPMARELRATRGATSIGWLRGQGLSVDRLDAFVFSTAMSGVIQRTRFAAPGARRRLMAEGEARLLGSLFGVGL